MKSGSDNRLADILQELVIKHPSYYKDSICAYSEASEEANLNFMKDLDNKLLLTLEKPSDEKFNYVTGEIACMTSPKFLSYCESVALEHRTKPNIGCDIHRIFKNIKFETYQGIPNEVYGREFFKGLRDVWEKEEGKKIKWQRYLYVCYEFGDIINLYGLPKDKAKIHFMTFADDYVYLQNKHELGQRKEMWLLKNKNLKSLLEEKLNREYFTLEYYLSPHLFKKFIIGIHSPIALRILISLKKQSRSKEDFESELRKIDKEWKLYMEDLIVFGFIRATTSSYKISKMGEEYLDLVFEGKTSAV